MTVLGIGVTVGYVLCVDPTAQTRAITRRFLQNRRRAPLDDREITWLVTEDVEYVEVVGMDAWTVVGPAAVLTLMRRYWSGLAMGTEMSVIRHLVLQDGTAVGHWRREVNGAVVNGRDTYTLREGRICRIVVEEFPGVTVPGPLTLARSGGATR